MKTRINIPFLLPGLVVGLGLTFTGWVSAQAFTNLYYFSAGLTNSDGAQPSGSLILLGNTLYGTAGVGGTHGNGSIFALNTNGTSFTNFHSFSIRATNSLGHATNSDGTGPTGGLIQSGSFLYGTAFAGGTNGNGTVFSINANGTGFTILHHFAAGAANALGHLTNNDGATPYTGLILSGTTLYGTACYGGTNGNGTVFALDTNGMGFTILHQFATGVTNTLFSFTNQDGAYPQGGVTLSGNALYGSAEYGGSLGLGTIYSLNTNGSNFTVLEA